MGADYPGDMRSFVSPEIPEPKGHYSAIVEHGGLLYVSGQLPVDPETGAVAASVEEQVRQVLENLRVLLEAAGSRVDQVLQTRIYLTDISHWERVNAEYASFFGAHKPARAIIPVGPLHFGCLVEVEATAVLP